MPGKCPKCEKAVTRANLSPISVGVPGGSQFKGITYDCPHCKTVLSVMIDPIAIKTSTIAEIVKKVKG